MRKRTRNRKLRGGIITTADFNRDRLRNLDTVANNGGEPSSSNPEDDKDAKEFYNFSIQNFTDPYPSFNTRLVAYLKKIEDKKEEDRINENKRRIREQIENEWNAQLSVKPEKKKSFFSSLKDRAHGAIHWMKNQMTMTKNRGGRSRTRRRRRR